MNFNKPIQLILAGSVLLGLAVLVSLILVESITGIDVVWWVMMGVPALAAVLAFAIFGFIVERFLNRKIKMIYKVISSKKRSPKDDEAVFSMSEDVLGKLTEDTAIWGAQQQEQIKKLEEAAAFRKEFLGNLAHELKTPVFSIQGYVLTLLEGGLEDKQVNRDFLERALNGVERMSDLLEDLDEIARFETDRFNLKIKKFDIVELTDNIFKELQSKAETKSITFEFDRDYEAIMVNADPGKIGQVLTNLISNSISYGNDNGTTTLRFHKVSNKQLMVEVADDGLGMDEKHLPRLFERFYRVDKSRERNVGGSGLGLAIVKHIIEAHGQTINVRSTEGIGSTFSFTLERG